MTEHFWLNLPAHFWLARFYAEGRIRLGWVAAWEYQRIRGVKP